jgi:hypothetical protein
VFMSVISIQVREAGRSWDQQIRVSAASWNPCVSHIQSSPVLAGLTPSKRPGDQPVSVGQPSSLVLGDERGPS